MIGKRFFGAETSIFVWEVYIFCLKCGQIFASKLTFCVCFTIHIQSEWAWEDHDAGRRTPHRIYVVVILKKANFQLFCLLPVTLWHGKYDMNHIIWTIWYGWIIYLIFVAIINPKTPVAWRTSKLIRKTWHKPNGVKTSTQSS